MPCYQCGESTYTDDGTDYCLPCDQPQFECSCSAHSVPLEVRNCDDPYMKFEIPWVSVAPLCPDCDKPIRHRPRPYCRCVRYVSAAL